MSDCIGICVSAADLGVGNWDQIAIAHPDCPEHGNSPVDEDSSDEET